MFSLTPSFPSEAHAQSVQKLQKRSNYEITVKTLKKEDQTMK